MNRKQWFKLQARRARNFALGLAVTAASLRGLPAQVTATPLGPSEGIVQIDASRLQALAIEPTRHQRLFYALSVYTDSNGRFPFTTPRGTAEDPVFFSWEKTERVAANLNENTISVYNIEHPTSSKTITLPPGFVAFAYDTKTGTIHPLSVAAAEILNPAPHISLESLRPDSLGQDSLPQRMVPARAPDGTSLGTPQNPYFFHYVQGTKLRFDSTANKIIAGDSTGQRYEAAFSLPNPVIYVQKEGGPPRPLSPAAKQQGNEFLLARTLTFRPGQVTTPPPIAILGEGTITPVLSPTDSAEVPHRPAPVSAPEEEVSQPDMLDSLKDLSSKNPLLAGLAALLGLGGLGLAFRRGKESSNNNTAAPAPVAVPTSSPPPAARREPPIPSPASSENRKTSPVFTGNISTVLLGVGVAGLVGGILYFTLKRRQQKKQAMLQTQEKSRETDSSSGNGNIHAQALGRPRNTSFAAGLHGSGWERGL